MSLSKEEKTIHNQSFPSICIPRTYLNITEVQVKKTFNQVFGSECVERVDMIIREGSDKKEFKRVFVHFSKWPETDQAQRVRRKLIEGKDIKLVYSEPWFWKCRASMTERPVTKPELPPRPYIHLSDSDDEEANSGAY